MNPGYANVRFQAELPQAGLPVSFGVITSCNPNGKIATAKQNHQATETLRRTQWNDLHYFSAINAPESGFEIRQKHS